MTTMVSADRPSQQVPALGESWAHVPTQRLILYWQDRQRHAVLYKSASVRQTDVQFQITVSVAEYYRGFVLPHLVSDPILLIFFFLFFFFFFWRQLCLTVMLSLSAASEVV